MLREIRCDKFMSNGSVRAPIIFHTGLNAVLGTNKGTNSIGKSTFLMIIDFAFGGNDYADKNTDVIKNVGPHDVFFCFEFDDELFYFSRSPLTKKEVNVCDSDYKKSKRITVDEYRAFLHEKYNMESGDQTFRGAVGTFFRIYLRDCCDEGRPLKNGDRVPDKNGIIELVKLFNKYDSIAKLLKELNIAKEEEKTFRKAISFNQILAPANKTEYKKNEDEIMALETEIEELSNKSDSGILEVDSVKAKEISVIKGELSKCRRTRTLLKSQLSALIEEMHEKLSFEKDFSELLKFFPGAAVKKLDEVENFHKGLQKALVNEYKQKQDDISGMLDVCEGEISALESRLNAINSVPNVSKVILEHYADIKQKYNDLVKANRHYEEKVLMKEKVSSIEEQVSKVFESELSEISSQINSQMYEYNNYVYQGNHSAPYIMIKDENHYDFNTPNDRGTGSRYRGLILFDMSVLMLTKLPVVVHDSFMLKQIEDVVLEKLLELYSQTDKQVFIALDKQSSYTRRTQEILSESVILNLSNEGNELFGRSWNIVE